MYFDAVIFGAGLYGLYAAKLLGNMGREVLVIEREKEAFSRATFINQARVHMGYHYPRSISTAKKSAAYFERFCNDFGFCINKEFKQIYATSKKLSWTDAEDFRQFCTNAGIPCERIDGEQYFKPEMCDGAYLTTEYTYDAKLLREYMLAEVEKLKSVRVVYGHYPESIIRHGDKWEIAAQDLKLHTPFVLNSTYASVNEVLNVVGGVIVPFRIKYEKCEIILCSVSDKLKDIGITVMDGPFFSIMPFGKTGLHSLTSVTFTPHETSYGETAEFPCQKSRHIDCRPGSLQNCNTCQAKPVSAWPYMSQLARKYLNDKYDFCYYSSMYSIKPILQSSEIDDSRPTVIRKHCESPTLISVLSGKINTVYDLEEALLDD